MRSDGAMVSSYGKIEWGFIQGGRISIVGVYVATINHFNLGAFFEKGMSMAGGQTPCQKYWPKLLELIQSGACPSFTSIHSYAVCGGFPFDECSPMGCNAIC